VCEPPRTESNVATICGSARLPFSTIIPTWDTSQLGIRGGKRAGGQLRYLGWQARILPYLEMQALWSQTIADYEKARSPFGNPPHAGLSTVVSFFACPTDDRLVVPHLSREQLVAFTSYLGIEGVDVTALDGVLFRQSKVRLLDITDGTSTTLMVGERPPSADLYYGWWYAGTGQRSTGSGDSVLGVRELNLRREQFANCSYGPYSFSEGRLSRQCDQFHFWSLHPGGAHFAFCDGSVRFLAYSADPIMPALATRAGGEAVTAPD
jgi:prepilin-type processing-associated H-X9-DG protein